MKCEDFQLDLVSELYGELPLHDRAVLLAHEQSCEACATRAAALRTGRGVEIEQVEPPESLDGPILAAAAQHSRSRPGGVVRALAWAGSHAMRPQLAMAALFCLVVGSSVLLLRDRDGLVREVRVSEQVSRPSAAALDGERGRAESATRAAPSAPLPAAAAEAASPAARTSARCAEEETKANDLAKRRPGTDSEARARDALAACKRDAIETVAGASTSARPRQAAPPAASLPPTIPPLPAGGF
jgi:hypothetical protein